MISVVIPWYKKDVISQTLPTTLSALNDHSAEVLLVGFGWTLDSSSIIGDCYRDSRVRIINAPADNFNKCRCLNLGAFHARGDSLLTLDADIVLSKENIAGMLSHLSPNSFVTIAIVRESNPELHGKHAIPDSLVSSITRTTEIRCRDGRAASIEYREGVDGSRCGPGIMLVNKNDFVAIQGFNSELRSWGFEDYDLQIRLQLHLARTRITIEEAFHLTHPTDIAAQRISNVQNMGILFQNYSNGRFFGSYQSDIQTWSEELTRHDVGEPRPPV